VHYFEVIYACSIVVSPFSTPFSLIRGISFRSLVCFNLGACLELGGLRLQLHERLRPEPCQTVEIAPTPGVELELEPLAAFKEEVEPRFGGFTWLQLEIHQRSSYFGKRFFKTTQLHQRSQSRSRF
jgi:hypothetical protein